MREETVLWEAPATAIDIGTTGDFIYLQRGGPFQAGLGQTPVGSSVRNAVAVNSIIPGDWFKFRVGAGARSVAIVFRGKIGAVANITAVTSSRMQIMALGFAELGDPPYNIHPAEQATLLLSGTFDNLGLMNSFALGNIAPSATSAISYYDGVNNMSIDRLTNAMFREAVGAYPGNPTVDDEVGGTLFICHKIVGANLTSALTVQAPNPANVRGIAGIALAVRFASAYTAGGGARTVTFTKAKLAAIVES